MRRDGRDAGGISLQCREISKALFNHTITAAISSSPRSPIMEDSAMPSFQQSEWQRPLQLQVPGRAFRREVPQSGPAKAHGREGRLCKDLHRKLFSRAHRDRRGLPECDHSWRAFKGAEGRPRRDLLTVGLCVSWAPRCDRLRTHG